MEAVAVLMMVLHRPSSAWGVARAAVCQIWIHKGRCKMGAETVGMVPEQGCSWRETTGDQQSRYPADSGWRQACV